MTLNNLKILTSAGALPGVATINLEAPPECCVSWDYSAPPPPSVPLLAGASSPSLRGQWRFRDESGEEWTEATLWNREVLRRQGVSHPNDSRVT